MAPSSLWIAGVMTGNSLDAVDTVLTRFSDDGGIEDRAEHSEPYPRELSGALRNLREEVQRFEGRVLEATEAYERIHGKGAVEALHDRYLALVAATVERLQDKFPESIDLVGFHGQTCAHLPPSGVPRRDRSLTYTVQLGHGQRLADMLGIAVAFDFRSDDLFNGGEAAPFAPVHQRHLAREAERRKRYPLAFINGGNTGNISLISRHVETGAPEAMGWDVGPFNHFPDALMRRERSEPFDRDGLEGRKGAIDPGLLQRLFGGAATTREGTNFLEQLPPKSSDPEWYRFPPELLEGAPFEVRVRTAEYFAAYLCVLGLTQAPRHIELPRHFALCGGGWKNPVIREDLAALLRGSPVRPILPAHSSAIEALRSRLGSGITIEGTEAVGFNSSAMEARIFADAAFCRVSGRPFSLPAITGVATPTICGLLRFPEGDPGRATPALRDWIARHDSLNHPGDSSLPRSEIWSRATAGWSTRDPAP